MGIGDQGSVIPEKGRKIRILLLLYKKFDPNNQFLGLRMTGMTGMTGSE